MLILEIGTSSESGLLGATIAQPSMKICKPISSATCSSFNSIKPLRGAIMPLLRRKNAVCSAA